MDFLVAGTVDEAEDIPTPKIVPQYGSIAGIESEEFVSTDTRIIRTSQGGAVYLNGQQLLKPWMVGTLSITREMGAPNRCTFSIFDRTQALEFEGGADLALYWKGRRIFGGIVTGASYSSFHASYVHTIAVEGGGYALKLNRIYITDSISTDDLPEYGRTVKYLVDQLVYVYLKTKGDNFEFDYAGCPDIAFTQTLSFSFESIGQALDKICKATNTEWYCDIYKTIRIVKNDQVTVNAPFDVVDNCHKFKELKVKMSLADYANVVILRTATALSGTITETFLGNGDITQSFPLRYRLLPDDVPIVKLNGDEQIVVSQADPFANFQFSFLPGFGVVYPRTNPPVNVPFSITDVIEITYRVQNKNFIEVRDETAIGTQAGIEGGSGNWQIVLDVGDRFQDLASANAYGLAYLQKVKIPELSCSYILLEKMKGVTFNEMMALDVGQLQHIDTSQPIADTDAIVDSMTIRDVDGVFLSFDVTATTGRRREYWDKKLAEMLSKPTPQSNAMDSYGFAMAKDIPGFSNPGMTLTPLPVLTTFVKRKSIALSAMLMTTDPPGSGSVLIQLYKNNVAVFAQPMEYKSTDNQPVVLQLPGITFEQYDALAVRVLQVDSACKNFDLVLQVLPTGSQQTQGFI